MKRKTSFRIGVIVFFIFLNSTIFAQIFEYLSLTKGKSSKFVWEYTQDETKNTYNLVCRNSLLPETYYFLLSPDGSTEEWIVRGENGVHRAYIRRDNIIQVEESGENLKIDSAPWFASMEFGLQQFVKRDKREIEFWIIEQDKNKARKMTAKKMKTEILDITGTSMSATRVRVTAKGVPALFYAVTFWFRQPDGAFVKFLGRNGPPGTSVTETILIKEENE